MDQHNKARLYHQQADTDARIKKMLCTRNKEYNEYKYEDGEDIFVKDRHKDLWEGPVKVQHQEGNNVNIIKEGRVTSVPIQRTQPAGGKKVLEDISEETDEQEEENSPNLRPKRGEEVTFKVNGEKLQGIIKSVGKKSG